jgi:hypothetical protein
LKDRVELVWEFDEACNNAVQAFVDFAKGHSVEEETVMVPTKVKVAIPV